jgi:hypothetical protein
LYSKGETNYSLFLFKERQGDPYKGERRDKGVSRDHVTATKKNIPFDKPFIQLFELASVDIEQLSFQSDIPSHIEH